MPHEVCDLAATSSRQPWRCEVLTAFPHMYPGALGFSNIGKALENGLWQLNVHDLRQFASNKHQRIDDVPFGGGAGMVIYAEVIARAMDKLLKKPKNQQLSRYYMSPRGTPLSALQAKKLSTQAGAIILCGRYEGVDQRVLDHYQFDEISIGDYVISSGELASFVLIDSIVRLIPRVLGASASLDEESFEHHLLEYPHYTRPALWRDIPVPEVLLSGHHQRIAQWRLQTSLECTRKNRPDLYEKHLAAHSRMHITASKKQ